MKLDTKKKIIYILFLLVLQLVVLLYFGSQKKGMHFDECFSYFNTNNSVGRQVYDRTLLTSEDIMKDFYVKPGEQFNYEYVVRLQSYDVHPPVFYIFLHTLCSFMPGVYSIWQGISLNILYSLITTFFVFHILDELINNDKIALAITALYAINTGVICDAMYIRMYCLMTLWIAISIYLHLKMSKIDYNSQNIPIVFIVVSSILTYLGFMTHYFYLGFMFFIEAAFWLPRMFKSKKAFIQLLKYGLGLLIAGILGVLLYPSCLGHVNSGYRGQEVKGYLLDMSDFGNRFQFFDNLINKYVFNGFLYIYLLIIILLGVFSYYNSKKNKTGLFEDGRFIQCILIPVLGYYILSVKCSLMGDEAMMRYQLPIYGLSFICFSYLLYYFVNRIFKGKVQLYLNAISLFLILIISFCGLLNKNVFYLYQEQETMENISESHSSENCVYIYNNEDNKYFLWNDALQLAKYKNVYFINSENQEPITESYFSEPHKMIVYISTLNENEDFNYYLDLIYKNNNNLHSYEKLYDGMYATCYEFSE